MDCFRLGGCSSQAISGFPYSRDMGQIITIKGCKRVRVHDCKRVRVKG